MVPVHVLLVLLQLIASIVLYRKWRSMKRSLAERSSDDAKKTTPRFVKTTFSADVSVLEPMVEQEIQQFRSLWDQKARMNCMMVITAESGASKKAMENMKYVYSDGNYYKFKQEPVTLREYEVKGVAVGLVPRNLFARVLGANDTRLWSDYTGRKSVCLRVDLSIWLQEDTIAAVPQEPDEAAVLAARLEGDEVLRTRLRELNVLVTLKDKQATTGEEKDEHRADKPLRAKRARRNRVQGEARSGAASD
jgi:hypothetical protein